MVATRILILLLLGSQTAKAVNPDIPKHYEYRNIMFENLADEILNSAVKQDISLHRNQVLITVQSQLNTVFDEVVLHAEQYTPCTSTDEDCIKQQFEKLETLYPQKIENSFFNFYEYQAKIWTRVFIAPKNGWAEINQWYPQFIQRNFGLDYDTLCAEATNNFFLNSRIMCYRLKEELFPNENHIAKSLFSAYYNQCVYLLQRPSIMEYEFEQKIIEVDSLMNIAGKIKGAPEGWQKDISNVYIAAAFNDNFPAGVSKNELLKMFYLSNNLLQKALEHDESGKVHYAIGALYNNFLIDYANMFSTPEKLDLFGKSIVPSALMEEAIVHLEKACELDPEFCNLKKFRDKRK